MKSLNRRYLSIRQLLGLVSIPTLCFSQALVRPTCEAEGWAWASSFNYIIDTRNLANQNGESPLKTLHRRLALEERRIEFSITTERLSQNQNMQGEKTSSSSNQQSKNKKKDRSEKCGNICVAAFSFVLENVDQPNNPSILVSEPFEFEELNQEKPVEILGKHVFISGHDLPKSYASFSSAIGDTSFCCSIPLQKGVQPTDQDDKFGFIHPPFDHYASPDQVVERLVCRYDGVPEHHREWMKLQNELCYYLNHELFAQLESRFYKKATQSLGPETDDVQGIFFSHTTDSEQKLFYYLDFVTDPCSYKIKDFQGRLLQLIEKIIRYIETHPLYIASQVEKLMRIKYADRNPSGIGEQLKKINDSSSKSTQGIERLHYEISTLFPSWEAELISSTTHLENNNLRLKSLREFFYLLRNLWHNSSAYFQDNKFANNVDKDGILDILNENKASLEKLIDQENRPGLYTKDKFIGDFGSAVRLVLKHFNKNNSNGPYYIKAVILNCHSTNDCCYRCSPDLAQESARNNGFAEYFCSVVQRENPQNRMPFFQAMYSCRKLREGREHTVIRPILAGHPEPIEQPRLSDPKNPLQKTKFYQHYLAEPDLVIPSNNNNDDDND